MNFQVERCWEDFEFTFNKLQKSVDKAQRDPHRISLMSISNSLLRGVCNSIIANVDSDHIYTLLYYALQFGINHFILTFNFSSQMHIPVGNRVISTLGLSKKEYISFTSWQVLFYLATILRDKDSINFLSSIPNEFLISESVTHDDLTVANVNILKSMDNHNVQESIQAYWRIEPIAKDPTVSRKMFHFHLTTPLVRVLEAMLSGNNNYFNNELSKALQLHYDFYKSDRENYGMPDDWYGWISFQLLSVCAIAHDRGMKIEVESDYLPMWMVKGDFQNCKLLVT